MRAQNQNEQSVIKMDADFDKSVEVMSHYGIQDNDDVFSGDKAVGPGATENFKGIVPSMMIAHPDI